ncbi:recombinase zinc beta ribbon domain-containing protein, partial [Microbacterium testaceum]
LKHYLTDVAECACGQTMRARTVNSRGKKTLYYQCHDAGVVKDKTHTAIHAGKLEAYVEAKLYGFMSGKWFAPKGTGSTVRALRAEVAELESERDSLTDALTIKGVNRAKITTALAAVDHKRRNIDAQLEKALSDDFAAEWLEDLMKAGEDSYESADGFKKWFDALDPEKRRALVRGNVTIQVGKGQGLGRVSVDIR